ncbi:hypothetical protein [Algoriphagus aquimarinus]|uniref:hypothetical protein n=1 Tax=Algoriphagus aquimarinus TaxID=237018 RepID=UPI0030DBFD05|tara:strand:- start:7504 stop:8337 length:834 start_codon:yes stop_codon:yes gene_type:complete
MILKIVNILKWIVGVFSLLFFLGQLPAENPLKWMFLIMGLFITPYSHNLIFNKGLKFEFDSRLKWLIAFFGFLVPLIWTIEKTNVVENKIEESLNADRTADIEQVIYFLDNPFVTDEDGLTYNLEVEKNKFEREKLFESEKIFFNNSTEERYCVVSSYKTKYEFKLTSNGDLVNTIILEAFVFKSLAFRPHITPYRYENGIERPGSGERVPNRFDPEPTCSYEYLYFPDLDYNKKKKLISNFTGGENIRWTCGGWGTAENLLTKTRIEAVKRTGIIE